MQCLTTYRAARVTHACLPAAMPSLPSSTNPVEFKHGRVAVTCWSRTMRMNDKEVTNNTDTCPREKRLKYYLRWNHYNLRTITAIDFLYTAQQSKCTFPSQFAPNLGEAGDSIIAWRELGGKSLTLPCCVTV